MQVLSQSTTLDDLHNMMKNTGDEQIGLAIITWDAVVLDGQVNTSTFIYNNISGFIFSSDRIGVLRSTTEIRWLNFNSLAISYSKKNYIFFPSNSTHGYHKLGSV